jgi:hypothetical protein
MDEERKEQTPERGSDQTRLEETIRPRLPQPEGKGHRPSETVDLDNPPNTQSGETKPDE